MCVHGQGEQWYAKIFAPQTTISLLMWYDELSLQYKGIGLSVNTDIMMSNCTHGI